MLRLLTAVVLCFVVFVVGGCGAQTDLFVGTFAEFLREGELDDRKSFLTLRLFRGGAGNLCGEMFFDGDVQIMGFDVWDGGFDPYPIDELSLDLERESIKGKIDIPDFLLNAGFKGDFEEGFEVLDVEVKMLGKIALMRIDDLEDDSRDDEDRPKKCR